MPIICDWYHHDCLLSCCSIFKVLCFVHRSELVYYITLFSACQALFSKFFNFFLKPKFQLKSLVFGLLMSFLSSRVSLSRWQLIYNIMPKLFCQHLFWKNPDFFQKSGKSPLFPLSMRVFDAKNFSFLYKSISNSLFFLFFFFLCIAI